MDYIIQKTVEKRNAKYEEKHGPRKKWKIGRKTGMAMVIIGGSILTGLVCYGIYLKYCQKTPNCQKTLNLNETQQELLYNILSKKLNNDAFQDVKNLNAKTDDEKAVKNFIVDLSQRTTRKDFWKDHINEFKKFTHKSWNKFKELANLNISKADANKIRSNIHSMILNPSLNQQPIIEDILKYKYPLFKKLAGENETLWFIIVEYWNEK